MLNEGVGLINNVHTLFTNLDKDDTISMNNNNNTNNNNSSNNNNNSSSSRTLQQSGMKKRRNHRFSFHFDHHHHDDDQEITLRSGIGMHEYVKSEENQNNSGLEMESVDSNLKDSQNYLKNSHEYVIYTAIIAQDSTLDLITVITTSRIIITEYYRRSNSYYLKEKFNVFLNDIDIPKFERYGGKATLKLVTMNGKISPYILTANYDEEDVVINIHNCLHAILHNFDLFIPTDNSAHNDCIEDEMGIVHIGPWQFSNDNYDSNNYNNKLKNNAPNETEMIIKELELEHWVHGLKRSNYNNNNNSKTSSDRKIINRNTNVLPQWLLYEQELAMESHAMIRDIYDETKRINETYKKNVGQRIMIKNQIDRLFQGRIDYKEFCNEIKVLQDLNTIERKKQLATRSSITTTSKMKNNDNSNNDYDDDNNETVTSDKRSSFGGSLTTFKKRNSSIFSFINGQSSASARNSMAVPNDNDSYNPSEITLLQGIASNNNHFITTNNNDYNYNSKNDRKESSNNVGNKEIIPEETNRYFFGLTKKRPTVSDEISIKSTIPVEMKTNVVASSFNNNDNVFDGTMNGNSMHTTDTLSSPPVYNITTTATQIEVSPLSWDATSVGYDNASNNTNNNHIIINNHTENFNFNDKNVFSDNKKLTQNNYTPFRESIHNDNSQIPVIRDDITDYHHYRHEECVNNGDDAINVDNFVLSKTTTPAHLSLHTQSSSITTSQLDKTLILDSITSANDNDNNNNNNSHNGISYYNYIDTGDKKMMSTNTNDGFAMITDAILMPPRSVAFSLFSNVDEIIDPSSLKDDDDESFKINHDDGDKNDNGHHDNLGSNGNFFPTFSSSGRYFNASDSR